MRKALLLVLLASGAAWAGTPQVIISGISAGHSQTVTDFGAAQGQESTAYAASSTTVMEVMPTAGTWSNMYCHSGVAPGTPKSYTITFGTNGTDSSLACAVSGALQNGSDIVDSSAVVAGDLVYEHVAPSGTPTITNITWSTQFNPTVANQYVLMGNGAPANNGTVYIAMGGLGAGGSITNARSIIPESCTMKDLYVVLSTAPGVGKSYTFAFDDNGGATPSAVSVTISGTNTTGNDVVHSSTTAPGDVVVIQTSEVGTPAATTASWGIVCAPAVAGQFPFIEKDSNAVTNTTDFLMAQAGQGSFAAAESGRAAPLSSPSPGLTLGNMYAMHSAAPGGTASYNWILRKNSASPASGTNCTITGTATTCNDTVNTVSIANSDLIDLEEVPAGTPGGTGINSVSFTGSIAQTAATVPGVSATSIIGCQLKVQGGKLVIQ